MTSGIYGYYDKEKEYVCYIGKDSNIDNINNRHNRHLHPSYYNSQPFNKVLQNNPDRYDYFILTEGDFTVDELNNMEKQAIKIFKTYRYDYPEYSVFNFTRGGDGSIGYKHNDNAKKKISKIHKGKKLSQKHREKLSEKNSGENNPMYGRKGKNHPAYGHKHTQEWKDKMSERMSGENNPNYGKKLLEETKKKISKSLTNKFAGENNPNCGKGDSGILYVSKSKSNRYTQGYIWVYNKKNNNKRYEKRSVNLRKLEKNVLKDNKEWIILDKEKAKQSYQESDKNNKR